MTRTHVFGSAFLSGAFLGGVLTATLATTGLQAQQAPAQPAPARQGRPAGPPGGFSFGKAGTIQKVAENLYVIPGGGGNTTVYVTSKGVVIVDMKTRENGQAILDQIKTVTDKPVIYAINTHVHMDHTGGNPALPESVEIVAHANLAAALSKDPAFQDPAAKRGLVYRTYTKTLTLLSGDDAVDLYHFAPAHTNGDSLVVFRTARAIATGDLFAGKGQPIIDTMNGGSGLTYGEAIASAASTIQQVDIVIPGHAPATTWQEFVDFGEFNRLFLAHARASLKAGKTPLQAMEDFKAAVPAKFKDYRLGAGMMTGPGGNFEPIFQELQAR